MLPLFEQFGLVGVFFNAFLAASIVPFPSEPIILLAATQFDPWSVFLVSVIGGVLGAVTNYYIGLKGLSNFFARRSPKSEKRAREMFGKYGYLVLLAAPWVPFVGDPLVIVAGVLRMDFRRFLALITVARIIKTAVLVFLSMGLFSL